MRKRNHVLAKSIHPDDAPAPGHWLGRLSVRVDPRLYDAVYLVRDAADESQRFARAERTAILSRSRAKEPQEARQ
jgi:hypothetical protein